MAERLPKDSTGTGRLVYTDNDAVIEAASEARGSAWQVGDYSAVDRAVDLLPLRQRAVVILLARRLSYSDIASLLQTSTESIARTYRRARFTLRLTRST